MMVVRLFMLQHDCGHGAFFRSQKMNNLVGGVLGVFTLVPYAYWRRTHAIHHATSGNLDVRGLGDIDTLTVREYLSRPKFKRVLYRMYRHPAVLLLVGPTWQFVLKHRLPLDTPKGWKREQLGVQLTNLALAGVIALMWWTLGLQQFLLVQLPITLIAGSIGVYLFYVQHQYEDTYWRYREAWNYFAAGLEGASHLTMPKFLQWCTANIGLHHIHHIASRIPNYQLQRGLRQPPRAATGHQALALEEPDDPSPDPLGRGREAAGRLPGAPRHPRPHRGGARGRRGNHGHEARGGPGLMAVSVPRAGRTAAVAALLLLVTSVVAAQELKYEVSFPNAVHHEAQITLSATGLPRRPVLFQMSRSSPGRYAVHEFAKNVYRVSATDGGGNPLTVTRTDPSTWSVAGHAGTVQFTYTLYADRADGTYSQVDVTHAHLEHARLLHLDSRTGIVADGGVVPGAARLPLEGGHPALPDRQSVSLHRAQPPVLHGQPGGAQQFRGARMEREFALR